MYESFYGFSARPFELNPDPAFYFASKGHQRALAYLHYGVVQGQGFIVITGEVGAGKTTLVRNLLARLDPSRVVAAQLVSTQLNGPELLRAVATSFGLGTKYEDKSRLLAEIEAFFLSLALSNRRPLLVVDEAQNLSLEALEELRMLSNFAVGPLQSFLIGQPQLRKLMRSPDMEQLRQRVIASCHLGALDRNETQAYVEYRLKRVGWKGSPEFTGKAFDLIHVHAGGIPREINTLCSRLLLAGYLAESRRFDADAVEQAVREVRDERGESNLSEWEAAVFPGSRPRAETLPESERARQPQLVSISGGARPRSGEDKLLGDARVALTTLLGDLEKCVVRLRAALADPDPTAGTDRTRTAAPSPRSEGDPK